MSSLNERVWTLRGRTNGEKLSNGPTGFNLIKVPLDVVVLNTDSDGFLNREEHRVDTVFQQTLRESLKETIPTLKTTDASTAADVETICYEGNCNGEEIDLNEWPLDVEYIRNTFSKELVPILFICNKKSVSRNSSSGSQDSQPEWPFRTHTSKRKPSNYVRKMLNADFRDSPSKEDSVGQKRCITETETAMKVDVDDHKSSYRREGMGNNCGAKDDDDDDDDDDVFPLEHPLFQNHFLSKESATVGRLPLPATQSLLDLAEPVNQKNQLRRPGQRDGRGQKRRAESQFYSVGFHVSESIKHKLRSSSDGLQNSTKSKNSEKIRRQGAMKRKSLLNMDHLSCVLRLCTDDGWSEVTNCTNYTTIGELKQKASQKLAEQGKLTSNGVAMTTISLTYSWKGKVYELYNTSQILLDTAFYKRLFAGNDEDEGDPPSITIKLGSHTSYKELSVLARITKLTNVLLDKSVESLDDFKHVTRIQGPDMPEVQSARRSLHDLVVSIADERDNNLYALSPDVHMTAIPTMLSLKVPYTNKLPVTFHYFSDFSLTRDVNINYSAEFILSEIYPCLVACKLISKSIEAYTLQVTGEESYVCGKVELVAFRDIRRCIAKGEPIHLSVVEKPTIELYRRFDFSWLPLDPNSNSLPLHSQASSDFRDISESVWDCKSPFKLTVVRGENLPFSIAGQLLVEVSLHLGAKTLHGAKRTSWVVQDNFNIAWNQELEFLTELKDIPKLAKILVILRQSRSRDSDNRTFYWGLLSVFDHRGMLHTGDHVVYLWEAKLPREEVKKLNIVKTPIIELKETVDCLEKINSILAGPTANNPSSKAVRIVVNFGTPDKAIQFPSTSEKSRQSLFKHHPAIRNIEVRKQLEKFHKLLFTDRLTEKKIYHALPRHLLLVNWSDFTHCLEVYSILDSMRQDMSRIPLHVALQLLDSDFHDENVRAFAVEVLEEKLLDEDLEDYILQLTQALKFEPYHDSPLARFLLKKALSSRKIGQLFFWYLKSEMYDAQYMPRFAVILEAYLKGCGEAIMTNFIDQVDLQNSLQATSEQLKRDFGKDGAKMQEVLPCVLKEKQVTSLRFVSPYSHRFKLGDLRVEKCKVMSSAKKPLWLEFVNVTPSSTSLTPVRLIYKTGDDLRQDVITLRMLSLFDKLWENEGLDLKLIPYGCLATSTNTGFIEVVKNARTISEVSGVSENHKKRLYQWIISKQTNEYGEIDPDKVKAAVNTFMRSCAGYSVATYALGIGDRHNDNIMVTTSGNLFHIDFGHFLGNIKYYKGIRREWAPFVLTPDFVYVLGGEQSEMFQTYKNLCCRAFLILRRHADLIISLFALMRSTGIPELACVDDIDYIRTALVLEEPDSKAEAKFLAVIQQCLDLKWTVQLSWIAHNLRHKTSS